MSRNGDVNQPTREFPEYPADSASTDPAPAARPVAEPDGPDDAGRRGPARGLLLVLGAAALVVVVLLGTQVTGLWPSWRNPFAQETTDRSQPPLLKSIRDLSRYVAAEGNFQVVVDLETDRKYVPDFLLNERTLFVGAGRVEAYVDFSKIAEGAVVESADGKSVEITLPAPQMSDTNLDIEKSYVFAEKRGLLNRLGDVFADDPNRQREVYRLAEERITAAARDSELAARAEANTRKMLEGLLRSLGYQTVTVTYTKP
ncbi:DUF4230 domain-containing protein [Micromonospora sp. NBRC 101691]|uniref:DUF4230 domain-containing protein n=1 Tax=Micromonospora sp. NBRC 101691 TaxID=3032198 RepID=UPI00249F97D5|nr:DUF4230 domain-containing protein [Micromonospora sp. NBRC 101691]GLY26287.1 hypothetical protein Misp04_60180 [Micromonospora sp. NBRC 101691]